MTKKAHVFSIFIATLAAATLSAATAITAIQATGGRTTVSIVGDAFFINGQPTLKGRTWRGHNVEGLLPNSRMVQGIFDDLNPETRVRWSYPDGQAWDAARNTREFVAAVREWRQHGLLAFTLNLQGGSPEGYSKGQPWHNSAFDADGTLRPDYAARLELVLDEADRQGMVVILGLFYFGQDQRLRDEAAVVTAVDAAVNWVLNKGYRNVIVEIDNEADIESYDHPILKPARVTELIERVKRTKVGGRRLLVSTSLAGNRVPAAAVIRGVRLRPAARQRRFRSEPHRRDGRRGPQVARVHGETDRLQRGRPLRLRETPEQLRRGDQRARVMGLLRLPPRR